MKLIILRQKNNADNAIVNVDVNIKNAKDVIENVVKIINFIFDVIKNA